MSEKPIIFLSAQDYNKTLTHKTGIAIVNNRYNETTLRIALVLLREVISDDGSRYNRPSYYYKISKFIKEIDSKWNNLI